MLCILYVNIVGFCLGIAALLVERALPSSFPRRWLWCLILAMSIVVPGYYRGHHNWSVGTALSGQTVSPPSGGVAESPFALQDPAWWQHTESLDKSINRIWLTLSAVLLLWGVGNFSRVTVLVWRARRRQGGSASIDGVPVVVTDSIGPATAGLWDSRVLVPRWVLALSSVQRRYVLRHEDEHRRAHDAHLLLVTSLVLLLMPWNLAAWWQLRRLALAVETDCDNRVVAALGDPRRYGELLLRVAEATSSAPRLQPALLGAGMLERRLRELVGPPRKQVQRLIAAAAACALLALALSMPHPVLSTDSHNHSLSASAPTSAHSQHH
jgi:beta-lactamase regulating signal transducer with metallopeptidase domain